MACIHQRVVLAMNLQTAHAPGSEELWIVGTTAVDSREFKGQVFRRLQEETPDSLQWEY